MSSTSFSVVALATTLLAGVSGCATATYVDPTLDDKDSGPTARLVLRNSHADGASFRTFGDAASCRKPRAIAGASSIAASEEADIGVVAGRAFTFAARRVSADGCTAIATFTPESGKQYLAQFGSSGSACWLNVVRVESVVPPRVTPEPTLRTRRAATAPGADAACLAD